MLIHFAHSALKYKSLKHFQPRHTFRGAGKSTWEAFAGSFTRMSRLFAMKDEMRAVNKIARKIEQEAISLDLFNQVRAYELLRW